MPRFEPFRATRYDAALPLADVTAPPYDVLSEDDLDALTARHERNVVRIDVPREREGAQRYEAAAQQMDEWEREGALVTDDTPSFTIYRMAFTDESGGARVISGVLGGLEVVDEGAGGVLPHERTTPKATTDRLDLTRATKANLSPVWGLSLAAGLTELLAEPGTSIGSYTDDTGVTHTVERIDDVARTEAIASLVGGSEVVIADGHHRYAVARTYRDELRAEHGNGPWDLTLTYVNELVADQLSVAAIHRLYHDITAAHLRDALEKSFDFSPAGQVDSAFAARLLERKGLCVVDERGKGMFLWPRISAFEGVRDLDSARLEHALRDTPHTVTYQHGVGNVLEALRAGQAQAAVLIRPVPVEEIRRTAHERLLMPPKSTFFTPKLKTGLVFRKMR